MANELEGMHLDINRPPITRKFTLFEGQKAVFCHFPMKQGAIMRDWLRNLPTYGVDREYSVEHSPDIIAPTTFIVQETGWRVEHFKLEHKAFRSWKPIHSIRFAPLSMFRDRLAIILPQSDVFRCNVTNGTLILITGFLVVKCVNNVGQSMRIEVVLGRKAMKHVDPHPYPYDNQ